MTKELQTPLEKRVNTLQLTANSKFLLWRVHSSPSVPGPIKQQGRNYFRARFRNFSVFSVLCFEKPKKNSAPKKNRLLQKNSGQKHETFFIGLGNENYVMSCTLSGPGPWPGPTIGQLMTVKALCSGCGSSVGKAS